jgi:hypothetical protein
MVYLIVFPGSRVDPKEVLFIHRRDLSTTEPVNPLRKDILFFIFSLVSLPMKPMYVA